MSDTSANRRPLYKTGQRVRVALRHEALAGIQATVMDSDPYRAVGRGIVTYLYRLRLGKFISAFMDSRAGKWGMNVPSLNFLQRISAPSFQETTPAVVSGPTTIGSTVPDSRTKTRCQ